MEYYKKYLTNKSFLWSLGTGLLFLSISLIAQFYSSIYATHASSDSVTDIILSNTRVYDVDMIFTWGPVALLFLVVFICVKRLNYMPFIAKSIAVFTLIRSMFVSLTHISPFPTHIIINSTFFADHFLSGIFSGNDLFFSGHTGLPFLLALIFWENKILRFIFLGFSLMFAVVVLLGHLHYSIDVFAAFFITYSIFDICKFLFKKEFKLFHEAL
jgi:hypothetical protein